MIVLPAISSLLHCILLYVSLSRISDCLIVYFWFSQPGCFYLYMIFLSFPLITYVAVSIRILGTIFNLSHVSNLTSSTPTFFWLFHPTILHTYVSTVAFPRAHGPGHYDHLCQVWHSLFLLLYILSKAAPLTPSIKSLSSLHRDQPACKI